MKFKLNKITILISAILTITLLAVIVNKMQDAQKQNNNVNENFSLNKISQERVEKIEIVKAEEAITLEKNEQGWLVNGKTAKQSEIGALISKINNGEIDQTVSTNPENHGTFGVDDENGITVKFYKSGNNLIEQFIIGDYATGGKTYIRKVDEDNVYTINTSLTTYLAYEISDWENEEAETQDESTEETSPE